MRTMTALGGLAIACAIGAGAASAQDNMKKLQDFKQTGSPDFTLIEQTGAKADQIRKNLSKVKLPPGFKIDLYAMVPDARSMAVGTNAGVVFVGTRKSKVWAVTDRDKDRQADEVDAKNTAGTMARTSHPRWRSSSPTGSASPRTGSSSSPSTTVS